MPSLAQPCASCRCFHARRFGLASPHRGAGADCRCRVRPWRNGTQPDIRSSRRTCCSADQPRPSAHAGGASAAHAATRLSASRAIMFAPVPSLVIEMRGTAGIVTSMRIIGRTETDHGLIGRDLVQYRNAGAVPKPVGQRTRRGATVPDCSRSDCARRESDRGALGQSQQVPKPCRCSLFGNRGGRRTGGATRTR